MPLPFLNPQTQMNVVGSGVRLHPGNLKSQKDRGAMRARSRQPVDVSRAAPRTPPPRHARDERREHMLGDNGGDNSERKQGQLSTTQIA